MDDRFYNAQREQHKAETINKYKGNIRLSRNRQQREHFCELKQNGF